MVCQPVKFSMVWIFLITPSWYNLGCFSVIYDPWSLQDRLLSCLESFLPWYFWLHCTHDLTSPFYTSSTQDSLRAAGCKCPLGESSLRTIGYIHLLCLSVEQPSNSVRRKVEAPWLPMSSGHNAGRIRVQDHWDHRVSWRWYSWGIGGLLWHQGESQSKD